MTQETKSDGWQYSQQEIAAEHEREEQLVLFKQRPTHAAVQIIGEMISQITQPLVQVLRFIAVI